MTWMVLFGVPLLAILVIIGFAWYHSSEVRKDDRDDKPLDE